MKIFVCTIISILFCAVTGNCQHRKGVVVCEFEVSRSVNIDQLGEKKKFPIDYCILAELTKYDHLLELPCDKTDKKKPCIKMTDFVKSKKNRPAIAKIVAWQQFNKAKYLACSIRLTGLQSSALATYRQKFYGKYKPEPRSLKISPVVQPTTL